MSKIKDITPNFEPVALLRSLEERAKGAKAAIVILVNDKGDLYWDGCGVTNESFLWALRKSEYELMKNNENEE